jgi:hypothetical protein
MLNGVHVGVRERERDNGCDFSPEGRLDARWWGPVDVCVCVCV